MASKNKQVLLTNHTSQRNFNYIKGNTVLNFTLRTDVKAEMKDFLELLEKAN